MNTQALVSSDTGQTQVTNYACFLYLNTATSIHTKAKSSLHDSITNVDCVDSTERTVQTRRKSAAEKPSLHKEKSKNLPGICEVVKPLLGTSSAKAIKIHKRKTSRLTGKASSSWKFTPHVWHMPDKDFVLEWSLCQQKERHPGRWRSEVVVRGKDRTSIRRHSTFLSTAQSGWRNVIQPYTDYTLLSV